MFAPRLRLLLLALAAGVAACASASDRLNEGIQLQGQGRYMEAVYRYADAVEKDASLVEARERLVAVGDSALQIAMDDADDFERRDDPVAAAGLYREADRMLARVRSVGLRLDPPSDYDMIRRGVFDQAIAWQMAVGRESAEAGRWTDARRSFIGARGDFEPSRDQVEESFEAETQLLLDWADVEMADGRPRAAYGVAQEALSVRGSPARDVVLRVRELQDQALHVGTVVIAIPPVTATAGVRELLGPEFEIQLDDVLGLDHWSQPPLFVDVADPLIMRRELRGLLRGVTQTPLLVGRALQLIGGDLAVVIEVSRVGVIEEDVRRRTREVELVASSDGRRPRGEGRDGGSGGEEAETPTADFDIVSGELRYDLEADIVLVDIDGREVGRFVAQASESGPFERAEYEGNYERLALDEDERALFDGRAEADQRAPMESALLADLAVAIAGGAYDLVLSRVY